MFYSLCGHALLGQLGIQETILECRIFLRGSLYYFDIWHSKEPIFSFCNYSTAHHSLIVFNLQCQFLLISKMETTFKYIGKRGCLLTIATFLFVIIFFLLLCFSKTTVVLCLANSPGRDCMKINRFLHFSKSSFVLKKHYILPSKFCQSSIITLCFVK